MVVNTVFNLNQSFQNLINCYVILYRKLGADINIVPNLANKGPMFEAMVCLSLYVMPYTTRMQLVLQEWELPSKSTGS